MTKRLRFLLVALLALTSSGCSEALGFRGILGKRVQTAYRGAVSLSRPTYWWFANDPAGDLREWADSNPALDSGAVNYNRTTMVLGEQSAIQTSGSGIFFTLTTDAVLTGDFTLEWWYKRDSAGAFHPMWAQAAGFQPEVYFFNGVFSVIDTNGVACAASTSLNNTNIHYLVVTRSGTTCTIYADDVDVTTTHNAWTGSLTFTIHQFLHETGSGNGSTTWQHGAIYVGTVLSATERTAHWNAGH